MSAVTDHPSAADPDTASTPDATELVARIKELQPLLREHAAQGEQDRRVVEDVIQALRAAGVLKIATPKRYGGYETSMRTMLDVSAALGEADGGTAWVATLLNVCAWMTGTFPQRAQDDVWGEDPDALVCGVLAPTAETRKVEGGHQVSGRWYYNSGSWHATWAILGIPLTDESGEVVDQALALIPRRELEYEETWFVAGMRSTGSNCMIAKDVFVPDHRIVSVPPPSRATMPPSTPMRPCTSRRSCRSWRWSWPGRSSAWAGRHYRWSGRRQLKSRSRTPSTPRRPTRWPSSSSWPRRRC